MAEHATSAGFEPALPKETDIESKSKQIRVCRLNHSATMSWITSQRFVSIHIDILERKLDFDFDLLF